MDEMLPLLLLTVARLGLPVLLLLSLGTWLQERRRSAGG
jgi:hypothetical protein